MYAGLRLPLLIAVLAYLVFTIAAGRGALTAYRLEVRPLELLAALVATFVAYQLLFVGWLVLIRCSGFAIHAPLSAYARAWWTSYMFRYFPGKVLLLVERARSGNALGLPRAVSAVMPIIETFAAILAGSVMALLAITYFVDGADRLLLAICLLMFGLVALLPVGYRWLVQRPAVRKRFPALSEMRLDLTGFMLVSLPYLAHYVLLGISFFLVARMLVPLPWSRLPAFCGIYALSHVVSLIVVVAPAGLGVREGALTAQLDAALPGAVSGLLAVGARVWFTAVEILCFVAVMVGCPVHPSADIPGEDADGARS